MTDEVFWDGVAEGGASLPAHYFGPSRPRTVGAADELGFLTPPIDCGLQAGPALRLNTRVMWRSRMRSPLSSICKRQRVARRIDAVDLADVERFTRCFDDQPLFVVPPRIDGIETAFLLCPTSRRDTGWSG